jgi:hypothetical protein
MAILRPLMLTPLMPVSGPHYGNVTVAIYISRQGNVSMAVQKPPELAVLIATLSSP